MATELASPHGPITVGTILHYIPFAGSVVRVQVTRVERNIKNGRPGFDGIVTSDGSLVWGYTDQITHVEG